MWLRSSCTLWRTAMTPTQMKELIKQRPFVPIRLHLAGGDTVEGRFPELTLVTDLHMFIGWKDPKEKRRIARDGVLVGWSAIKSYELIGEQVAAAIGGGGMRSTVVNRCVAHEPFV